MTHADNDVRLPTELDEITPAFLTAALARKYPRTRVASVEIVDLKQGSASSLRLRVNFDDNPHALPLTMFMKGDFIEHEFTSPIAFAGEAHYFTDIAETLRGAVTQPHAYFSGVDEDGQAIVVLEDLARHDATFGDCDQPLSVDAVADGVRQLAAMQGLYWQGRGLEKFEWVNDVAAVATLMVFLLQPEYFNDYIERERASFLSAALRDRPRIEAALHAMFATDKTLPPAFVHGDAHIGNTFRDPGGKLGFCDFQAVGRGPYIWDISYFITGALSPEDRASSERDLLTLYLDELRRHGADDAPGIDTAFLAHRRHMMHGYMSILTPTQMQPDRFATAMGQRFAIAMEDLDTLGSFD